MIDIEAGIEFAADILFAFVVVEVVVGIGSDIRLVQEAGAESMIFEPSEYFG